MQPILKDNKMNLKNLIDILVFTITIIGMPFAYVFGEQQQKEMEDRYNKWLKDHPGWKSGNGKK